MFLEPSEMNVEMALEWAMAGLGKLYSNARSAKFAEKFEAWAYKAEAEKAGWKFPAAAPSAPWALA